MMYEDGTINQETLNALIALKAAMGRNDAVSLWNVDESLKNPPKATFGEKKAGSLVQEVYKAVMTGFSRGGVYAYRWAATYPDRVAAVYADAPVPDLKSWPGGRGKGDRSDDAWETFKKEISIKHYSDCIDIRTKNICTGRE
jgi:S-formylglutathione hydrolase FrmB